MTAVPPRLPGRRIVVVGAGTRSIDDPDAPIGNGRAIAVLAAREGAHVACTDRDAEAATETVRRIEAEGNRAMAITGDVADPPQCEAIVVQAAEHLGGLDGVVLNVGIGAGRGLDGTPPELWDEIFAVNLRGH